MRRLWISSLTDEAIRRGFATLKPAREYDALADAARSRSEADWLVGAPDAHHVTSTPITIQLDAGPGPEAMAAGMSQALGRLADAIAAREAAGR